MISADFEAWSLDHIQDRSRTTPKLHYKTALLSGVSRDKVHTTQQGPIQQPKVSSRHQSSNVSLSQQPQQQGTQTSWRSQPKEPLPGESSLKSLQAQPRGQPSVKEPTDHIPKEPVVNVVSCQNPNSNGSSPSNDSGTTPASGKFGGGAGTPQPTLRRSRSAPLLATGQLTCKKKRNLAKSTLLGHPGWFTHKLFY